MTKEDRFGHVLNEQRDKLMHEDTRCDPIRRSRVSGDLQQDDLKDTNVRDIVLQPEFHFGDRREINQLRQTQKVLVRIIVAHQFVPWCSRN